MYSFRGDHFLCVCVCIYRSMILNQVICPTFLAQETFANVWSNFGCPNWEVLLTAGGVRPWLLINIMQNLGQISLDPSKTYIVHNVSSAKLRSSEVDECMYNTHSICVYYRYRYLYIMHEWIHSTNALQIYFLLIEFLSLKCMNNEKLPILNVCLFNFDIWIHHVTTSKITYRKHFNHLKNLLCVL